MPQSHRNKQSNMSRHPCHRRAMLRNLVMNLIEHGRIRTTIQKAKRARTLADEIITLGKKGTLHHRRLAIEKLGSTNAAKRCVKKVFEELGEHFAERPGGYTRILRLPRTIRQATSDLPRSSHINRKKIYGTRLGDNATMVLWELCEKEINPREKPKKKQRRRKLKAKVDQEAAPETPAVEAEAPSAETTSQVATTEAAAPEAATTEAEAPQTEDAAPEKSEQDKAGA